MKFPSIKMIMFVTLLLIFQSIFLLVMYKNQCFGTCLSSLRYIIGEESYSNTTMESFTRTLSLPKVEPITLLTRDDLQYRISIQTENGSFEEFSGKNFSVSSELLKHVGIPIDKQLIELTNETVRDFVFATGASDNHFKEALDGIAIIQQNQPNRTILFYDLGLKAEYRQKVEKLCKVEVRKLEDIYLPSYVTRRLGFYAWKPIIVNEVLKSYSGVFWVDSSIRLIATPETWEKLYAEIVQHGKSVVMLELTGNSINQVTHRDMFSYLVPLSCTLYEKNNHGGGSMLWYRTRETYNRVLHWLILCSLDKNCIAPPGSKLYCDANRRPSYMNCHRFDQSAVNILLKNYFRCDLSKFTTKLKVLYVGRNSINKETAQICNK